MNFLYDVRPNWVPGNAKCNRIWFVKITKDNNKKWMIIGYPGNCVSLLYITEYEKLRKFFLHNGFLTVWIKLCINTLQLRPVLRIRIRNRIQGIHMFLGLPDPDPLVRGLKSCTSCKNSKKNLDSYYFVTLFDFFIFEKWCTCTFKK